MRLFVYHKNGITALAIAYNKGHAIKILSKELASQGIILADEPVTEVEYEDEKKGKIFLFGEK